jgi:hypothetical protein
VYPTELGFGGGGGNITCLVNSSQALVASYRYDPYGRLISSSGSQLLEGRVIRAPNSRLATDVAVRVPNAGRCGTSPSETGTPPRSDDRSHRATATGQAAYGEDGGGETAVAGALVAAGGGRLPARRSLLTVAAAIPACYEPDILPGGLSSAGIASGVLGGFDEQGGLVGQSVQFTVLRTFAASFPEERLTSRRPSFNHLR